MGPLKLFGSVLRTEDCQDEGNEDHRSWMRSVLREEEASRKTSLKRPDDRRDVSGDCMGSASAQSRASTGVFFFLQLFCRI